MKLQLTKDSQIKGYLTWGRLNEVGLKDKNRFDEMVGIALVD